LLISLFAVSSDTHDITYRVFILTLPSARHFIVKHPLSATRVLQLICILTTLGSYSLDSLKNNEKFSLFIIFGVINKDTIMRFIASFADQVIASVENISISFTYNNLLEGRLSAATMHHYLPEIEERRASIEVGRLKGFYCFEPELMDESEFWGKDSGIEGKCLKDNAIKATLNISDKAGQYTIILEWYQSSRELTETPLPELVQKITGTLIFDDIKRYCKYYE